MTFSNLTCNQGRWGGQTLLRCVITGKTYTSSHPSWFSGWLAGRQPICLGPHSLEYLTCICWAWWFIGRFVAFRPNCHGFESRSSRHVDTLGKFFTRSCLWRFGVKLRHIVSVKCRERLWLVVDWRGAIEIAWMNECKPFFVMTPIIVNMTAL